MGVNFAFVIERIYFSTNDVANCRKYNMERPKFYVEMHAHSIPTATHIQCHMTKQLISNMLQMETFNRRPIHYQTRHDVTSYNIDNSSQQQITALHNKSTDKDMYRYGISDQ